MNDFDHRELYDDQIAPLIDQIFDICDAHNISFVAGFMACRQDGQYHARGVQRVDPDTSPAEFEVVAGLLTGEHKLAKKTPPTDIDPQSN